MNDQRWIGAPMPCSGIAVRYLQGSCRLNAKSAHRVRRNMVANAEAAEESAPKTGAKKTCVDGCGKTVS